MTAMTTAISGSDKELIEISRAFNRTLMIKTNSGSQYYLEPKMGLVWDVTRYGVDGRDSFHPGVKVYHQNGDLRIGPWITTGLARMALI